MRSSEVRELYKFGVTPAGRHIWIMADIGGAHVKIRRPITEARLALPSMQEMEPAVREQIRKEVMQRISALDKPKATWWSRIKAWVKRLLKSR